LIYSGVSLLAAGIFILATLSDKYTALDRYGGAAWVFLLSMIILMPLIIPWIRRRYG